MQVVLNTEIRDYFDKPAREDDGRPLILRNVLINALNSYSPLEAQTGGLPPEMKTRMFVLSVQLAAAAETIDLEFDDALLLRDRVGLLYGPLVFGRVSEILA